MVDIITPPSESNPWIDILLIICTLAFAIVTIAYTILEKYIVTLVAIILCAVFAAMFIVKCRGK